MTLWVYYCITIGKDWIRLHCSTNLSMKSVISWRTSVQSQNENVHFPGNFAWDSFTPSQFKLQFYPILAAQGSNTSLFIHIWMYSCHLHTIHVISWSVQRTLLWGSFGISWIFIWYQFMFWWHKHFFEDQVCFWTFCIFTQAPFD